MPVVLPDLVTIDEAAAALKLTRSCVEDWVALRKIASVRLLNGRVRIPATELDRIVKAGTRTPFSVVRPRRSVLK